MRDHSIVSPRFWTGETGFFLRKYPDAQRVALYLMTCPNSNMIGLYYLPMPVICHELSITREGASEALRRVSEGGFAGYDEASETVFVYEMARFQIGESLKPHDNRVKAIEKQILQFRNSIFYKEFLKKYSSRFSLNISEFRSPFEAPSKPLRRGRARARADQEQEQEQEQEEESLRDSSEPSKATASEDVVLTFPIVGKGAKEWHLVVSKVAEYRETFPGLDVIAEARKARQWCVDNPTRRKTCGGMPKFISGWLSRVQNSRGSQHGGDRGTFRRSGRVDPEAGKYDHLDAGNLETPAEKRPNAARVQDDPSDDVAGATGGLG